LAGSEKVMGRKDTDSQKDQSHAPTGPSALCAHSPAHMDAAEAEQSVLWAFVYAASDGDDVEANWRGAFAWSRACNVVDGFFFLYWQRVLSF